MRWKVRVGLYLALVVVTTGQHHTIDDDVHGALSTSENVVVVPLPGTNEPDNREVPPPNMHECDPLEDNCSSEEDEIPGGQENSDEGEGESDDSDVSSGSGQGEPDDGDGGSDSGESEPDDGGSGSGSGSGSGEGHLDSEEDNTGNVRKGNIVCTHYGQVQGFYKHDPLKIQSFIDIPYGTFSRFEAPTEPTSWIDEVHTVSDHDKRCPQLDSSNTPVGNPDCLTLSVFVPDNVTNANVLFHIYDSNFINGSASPYKYGPEYLVTKEIILVLPNYRLGPLGFLCLDNDIVPGNAALKDLALALKWTRNNIHFFRGNPDNIVVSGDGTSGALAGYLAISPKSKEHVKGVIAESGAFLSHWSIDRDHIATATELAEKLVTDSKEVLDVFKDVNIDDLLTAAGSTKFKPCIETTPDAFLDATPWEIIEEMKTNISFMLGSADHAGMQEALDHTEASVSQLNQNHSLLLPNDLKFSNSEDMTKAGEKVKIQYFGESNINLNNRNNLSLYYTDVSYMGPMIRAARILVEAGATVYFYEFSYVGDLNIERNLQGEPLDGAARGDIVGYVFCQEERFPEEESDKRIVELMTNLWVSFMKTGEPSADDVTWEKLQKGETSAEQWLSIGTETEALKGLHLHRLQLWTELYKDHFVDNFALKLQACHSILITILLCEFYKNYF